MLREKLREKGLSKREVEVALIVAEGLTNKEVGVRLCVTEKTVKFHLTTIFRKLGVKSRTQMVVKCISMKEPPLQAMQDPGLQVDRLPGVPLKAG
jgi:DNA-binding NarL/FixJ family response regulator